MACIDRLRHGPTTRPCSSSPTPSAARARCGTRRSRGSPSACASSATTTAATADRRCRRVRMSCRPRRRRAGACSTPRARARALVRPLARRDVGMWLGINAPERIDRLVLCCTSAGSGARDVGGRAETVRAEGVEAIAEAGVARWLTEGFIGASRRTPPRCGRCRRHPDEGYAAAAASSSGWTSRRARRGPRADARDRRARGSGDAARARRADRRRDAGRAPRARRRRAPGDHRAAGRDGRVDRRASAG